MADLDKLLDVFEDLDNETQNRVIRKVEKEDRDAAEALRKLQQLQKSGRKMKKITQKIKDLV